MYLTRTQTITVQHLMLAVVNGDGWLRDSTSVEFQVLNPNGTVHTAWTQVVGGAGDTDDTGIYYPAGWTTAGGDALGIYTIQWRWADPDITGQTNTWDFEFELVDEANYSPVKYRTYLRPAQVFAEDVTTTDLAYDRLQQLIYDAQDYINRATRQFFRPVVLGFDISGRRTEELHLRTPVVGIEYVRLSRSPTNSDEALFDIGFNRVDQAHRVPPQIDERLNPAIRSRRAGSIDLFERAGEDGLGTYGTAFGTRFRPGRRNHRIKGAFGYLEPDGTTPPLIQEAALRLVVNKAPKIEIASMNGGNPVPAGPVSQEMVDRHLVSFVKAPSSKLQWALATDKRVEEILRMYKAPWLMGAAVERRL